MKNKNTFQNWILFLVLILSFKNMNAQNNNALSVTQKKMAAISALTATGDLENLEVQLHSGLDAGLTINEIKEALVQLYAYSGFPRSLNAINTFRTVLEERKEKGISDEEGKPIIVENNVADKYEQGRKVLEELTQTSQAKPAPGMGEFAPRADAFLKEHLFADIFVSDVLSYQQRELVTIAALSAMTGVEPQLQAHIGMGMNTGITKAQLIAIFDVIEEKISKEQAELARKILKELKE